MKRVTVQLNQIIGAVLLTVSFWACNDFLDEQPSKSTRLPITHTEQLDALLANYTDFCEEPNRAAFCGHDDWEFPVELYQGQPMFFPGPDAILQTYLGDYENLAKKNDPFWGGDGYKSGEYSKIFRANVVVQSLDNIEGTGEDKARLKAEAHFIRAYSHWNLVNTYALPYTAANASEPGVPLKKSTSFEEAAARATIEETYRFIESDLQEALKCSTALVQNGQNKHWRANTAAINGFAARYYLNRNRYEQALKYAENVLKEYDVLVDYNSEMNKDVFEQGVYLPSTFDWDVQTYTKRIAWKESLYMRYLTSGNAVMTYFPSQSLLDAYEDKEHDLRYRYHFVEDAAEVMFWSSYSYPAYVFFSMSHVLSGPTTAEMYLIKAECQARLGEYSRAMETVNALRAKRMVPGDWVELKAGNVKEAVTKILQERRREMPFSQRWFDMRRLNNNEETYDDVEIVTRKFYKINATTIFDKEEPITYTLEKNSRKYALPISENEIEISDGVIKQNVY